MCKIHRRLARLPPKLQAIGGDTMPEGRTSDEIHTRRFRNGLNI